jgi:hypothetical protein
MFNHKEFLGELMRSYNTKACERKDNVAPCVRTPMKVLVMETRIVEKDVKVGV